MRDEVPTPTSDVSKLPSGVDRSQLIASLRLTPRERFERAVQAGRVIIQFRQAKRVLPPKP